eukprot:6361851-Amphidinium_carterae.1
MTSRSSGTDTVFVSANGPPGTMNIGQPVQMVEGGAIGAAGARTKKRKFQAQADVPSSVGGGSQSVCASSDVGALGLLFPPWMLDSDLAQVQQTAKYVTVALMPTYTIAVPPSSWSNCAIEEAIARHMGVKADWLDFTWASNDVSVDVAEAFLLLKDEHTLRLNARLCEARSQGVRVAPRWKMSHLGSATFPHAVFDTVTISTKARVAVKGNGMGPAAADQVLMPLTAPSLAWIWIESDTGCDSLHDVDLHGKGSWLPFDRVFSLSADRAFYLDAADGQGYVALRRVGLRTTVKNIRALADMDFPLSVDELTRLFHEEDDDSASHAGPMGELAADAVPQTTSQEIVGAEVVRPKHKLAIGAPLRRSSREGPNDGPCGSLPPDFATWVADKLNVIEARQNEILQLLRLGNNVGSPDSSHHRGRGGESDSVLHGSGHGGARSHPRLPVLGARDRRYSMHPRTHEDTGAGAVAGSCQRSRTSSDSISVIGMRNSRVPALNAASGMVAARSLQNN